ncbi:hypothetical protein Hanom_Chr01g00030211 [Helianthus anomalus]
MNKCTTEPRKTNPSLTTTHYSSLVINPKAKRRFSTCAPTSLFSGNFLHTYNKNKPTYSAVCEPKKDNTHIMSVTPPSRSLSLKK